MRTQPRPAFATPEAEDAWCQDTSMADWKESPHEVLDLVDSDLEAHGLEVVIYDFEDDAYWWRIEPRARR